ncbi:homoserine dehydrogenase [Natrinema versiforme]|uniref:Homoserine dehydrogenase n=1 Tax=Natrinema versiforme TaxID=88724 RepID=A0A4V1G0D6_9EURY|nr:homoserine dehydrogenase [Natrinema versiforme]QCS44976.1 homoserine dehydrogenase [Natrinema versiforme]
MKLAVFGVGAVGESVLKLASKDDHEIVAIADSTSAAVDADGIAVEKALSRKSYRDQVGSEAIEDALAANYDVLIEATPTTLDDAEPGFSHVRTALERDRHAVLANKGPVAQRYAELREIERSSDGTMLFEATVGGAIPVLSTIADHSGEVTSVRGVLNGTANFILSRMGTEGLDYEHILAEAQDLGVAEADPSFDVQGTDTALKCVILANVLKDGDYTLADAEVNGIESLPGSALEVTAQDDRTIRLLGEVSTEGTIRVGPRLVTKNSSLAVSGTVNTVQLETEHSGTLNLSGQGAGGPETASAVLSDVRRLEREES